MTFILHAIPLLAFLGASTWVGSLAGRRAIGDLSRAERWAWSFWLGLVFDVLIYLACLAMQVSPGPMIMVVSIAILAVLSLLARSRSMPRIEEMPDFPARALLALTGAAAVVF